MRRHVVVDGSNIATEGRDAPSLEQLDEAVQAYMRQYGPEIVTVVVDATFPNRIARNERDVYEAAAVAGEIITPPAGAIGRGDAFILQIADRADATILSNDSFQEFHGQYDWLFDPGRLVGGKPVPHVGWVFMDRSPVRGPLSRRSVSAAKRAADGPVVAKAVAKRATKAAKATKPATAEKPAEQAKPAKAAKATKSTEAAAPAAKPAPKRVRSADSGPVKAPAVGTPVLANDALPFIEFVGAHPVGSLVEAVVEQFSSHGAYARVGPVQAYLPLKYLANPAPRSAKQVLRLGETRDFVVVSVDATRRGVDLAVPGVELPTPDDGVGGPVEAPPQPAKAASKQRSPARKKAAPAKASAAKNAAKKQASPQKAAARKAPAKKATAKKTAASKRSVG